MIIGFFLGSKIGIIKKLGLSCTGLGNLGINMISFLQATMILQNKTKRVHSKLYQIITSYISIGKSE
jgi:hypothetical protein